MLPHLWSKDAISLSVQSLVSGCEVYVNWSTGDSQIELGDFCVMTMPEMGVRRTC